MNLRGLTEDCMSSVRASVMALFAGFSVLAYAAPMVDLEQAHRAVAAADSAWAAAVAVHDLEASVEDR